jgi:hypothetical protein
VAVPPFSIETPPPKLYAVFDRTAECSIVSEPKLWTPPPDGEPKESETVTSVRVRAPSL